MAQKHSSGTKMWVTWVNSNLIEDNMMVLNHVAKFQKSNEKGDRGTRLINIQKQSKN